MKLVFWPPISPLEYGAAGVDFPLSSIVSWELARMGYADISTCVVVHSDIVAHYVHNAGTAAQKDALLPAMVTGACIGSIAMTEPAAGSDLQGIRTTATPTDNGWRINGSKTFITNGQHNDIIVVVARTDLSQSGQKAPVYSSSMPSAKAYKLVAT